MNKRYVFQERNQKKHIFVKKKEDMSEIEQRLDRLKLELSKTIINSEHQQWRENRINSYRKAVSIPVQAMAVIPVQPPTNTTTTQTVIKTSINLDDEDDILASITSARQQLVTSLSNPPNPRNVSQQKEIDDEDDDEFSTYSDEPKLDTQQKQQPQQRQQHQTQVQTQAATTTASSSSSSILKSKDASSLPSPVESSYGTSQHKQQQPSIQQIKSTSAKPAAAAYGLFGANKDETLDDIY